MIVSDLARFVVVAAMALVDASGELSYALLIAFAVCVGLGDGFFHPAFGGIVPLVVEHPYLASANALIGLSRHASLVVGPALAALAYAPAGSPLVFGLNALTFLVAAGLLWLARPRAVEREASEGTVREIVAGARYVAGGPWLWISIVLAAVVLMIGYAPFQALLPQLVDHEYGRGVGAYGFLFAIQAVGMVLGSLIVGQANPRRNRIVLAYAGWALNDVCVILLVLSPWFGGAAALIALRGLFVGFGVALWETLLMELVPEDKLSRVISLDYFGSLGLLPVGYALTALLTDVVSVHAILLGGFSLAFVLWMIPLTLRSVRTAA